MQAQVLNNRYEVVRQLGDGGFGRTFLVRDRQMPSARECVLKQLKPANDGSQSYELVKTRFQREAATLEQLGEHDQIPRLYAYFSEGDCFYLVEEYVAGQTLTQQVQQTGPQSEAAVRAMLVSLLPVLVHVHQKQIVHRDVKPDNIVVRQSDNKPVLIDFGAVKETMSTVVNTQGNSTHTIVIGTPGYMPAEQLAGRPLYASDLYGLGLTAIYLITGKTPQELDSDPATGTILWRGLAPHISPGFADLLDRSIQMAPHQRFASASEMFMALNALAVGVSMPLSTAQAPPQPQYSATVISDMPMGQTVMAPQAITPQYVASQVPSQLSTPAAKVGMSDWAKAMLMGSLVGGFVLAGLFIARPYQATSNQPENDLDFSDDQPAAAPAATTTTSPVAVQPTQIAPTSAAPTPSASPVSTKVAAAPTPSVSPTTRPYSAGFKTLYVTTQSGDPLNLRVSNSTSAAVVAALPHGSAVAPYAEDMSGEWYQVTTENGQRGWISASYVSRNAPAPVAAAPVPAAPPAPAGNRYSRSKYRTVTMNSGTLNIRSAPGGSIIGSLNNGEDVQVLNQSGAWVRIAAAGGREGWVAAQYLR